MSFSRNHMPASSCEHLQSLVHFCGRYYLSTTSGTISTSEGRMDISTLGVYSFSCNVSIDNYEMALWTHCPCLLPTQRHISSGNPIWATWLLCSYTTSHWLFHQKPETKINHSIVKEVDDTYRYYDSQLSATLQKFNSLVDQINETSEDSLSVYLTYAALAPSVLNSVALIIACECIYRVVFRRISQASLSASAPQPTVLAVQHSSNSRQPQVGP